MPAKTFVEIMKFNPHHGPDGRFATASGASSSTTTGKGFKGTLYHGSPATDIEEFDISRAGSNTQSGEKLIFFTDSKQMAEDFSYERIDTDSKFVQQRGKKGRVYEVDVEMKNPLDFRNLSDKDIENIIQLDANGLLTKEIVQSMASNHQLLKASLNLTADNLKRLGYDGLIANAGSAGHGSLEYAVVDSSQAIIKKSVTETRKAGFAFVDNRSAHSEDAVFSIHKTENDKRLVFGWASISITLDGEQLEDRQQDMIDPEDLEEAAYEYVLKFRDTGEEHISTMRKKGKLVESCVFTAEKQKAMGIPEGTLPIGWWIGFYIEDDDAWERVKNGTYKMFSIEGKANREPVEKADKEGAQVSNQRTIGKSDPNRYDYIVEVPVAKTFAEIIEIEKFNPYHGPDGRFASASGATSFTYAPGKSKAHDNAIAREKERTDRELTSQAGSAAATMVEKATEREPQLTGMLQDCAKSVGAEMVGLEYSVKSNESLARKIKSEASNQGITVEEAAAGMKDVNRYTMQLTEDSFVSGYNATMESLRQQGHEVVKVSNTLQYPTAEYRGVNTNLKAPDGSVWELQFHTQRSLAVKEPNHKLYEEQRADSTTPERRAELGRLMAENAATIPTPPGIETIQNIKYRG